MTHRMDGVVVLDREKPQQCDECGKIAELRPYGPGGKTICFSCAMKDEPGTRARAAKALWDAPPPPGAEP